MTPINKFESAQNVPALTTVIQSLNNRRLDYVHFESNWTVAARPGVLIRGACTQGVREKDQGFERVFVT